VDSDGDGIPDGCDTTPNSNLTPETALSLLATPNPFSNQLLLSLELSGYSNKGTLSVVDVIGQTILELPVEWNNSFSKLLDMNYLPSGMYYIQYKDDHFNTVQKILKVD